MEDVTSLGLVLHFKRPTTFWDHLICFRTDSPFAHVELGFSNSVGFTSDPQTGVHIFTDRDYAKEPIWKSVPIYAEHASYRDAAWFEANRLANLGLRYDWESIVGFLVPFGEHDRKAMMCSEAVLTCLQKALGDPKLASYKPWEVSPGKLYEIAQKVMTP